jgi:hypothetical protein
VSVKRRDAEEVTMTRQGFEATAWNNGKTGYGLKLSERGRNAYLKREWGTIDRYLSGAAPPVRVNVDKDSLWNATCRELIHAEIGRWFFRNGVAPWPKGRPPKCILVPRSEGAFDVLLT